VIQTVASPKSGFTEFHSNCSKLKLPIPSWPDLMGTDNAAEAQVRGGAVQAVVVRLRSGSYGGSYGGSLGVSCGGVTAELRRSYGGVKVEVKVEVTVEATGLRRVQRDVVESRNVTPPLTPHNAAASISVATAATPPPHPRHRHIHCHIHLLSLATSVHCTDQAGVSSKVTKIAPPLLQLRHRHALSTMQRKFSSAPNRGDGRCGCWLGDALSLFQRPTSALSMHHSGWGRLPLYCLWDHGW
jgi:hypothetical protein